MECGCVHTRDKLVKRLNDTRLLCPDHFEPIAYKKGRCLQCGGEVRSVVPQAVLAHKCKKCNPIAYKNRKKQRVTPLKKINKVLMERSNCIYRKLCIEIFINQQRLPCYECSDFKEKPEDDFNFTVYDLNLKELDNYILKKQNYEIGVKTWGKIFKKRFDMLLEEKK